MRKYYEIPCKCGKIHEIQKSQAGAVLSCECGESFEAPSLRDLEKFPTIERDDQALKENPALQRDAGVWQQRQGWILFLLVAAALAAYGAYYYYSTRPIIPPIQDMELIDTWYTWQDLRPGITAPLSRFEEMRMYQIQTCWRWVGFYSTISILSFLSAALILFLPASNKPRKRSIFSRFLKIGGHTHE